MLRSILGSALAMPAKQRATIIARAICWSPLWDQLIVEACQQLPNRRAEIEDREFAIDEWRFEAEDPCSLEVIVAIAGQSFLMGYFPVPQVGPVRPELVQVGGYEVRLCGNEAVIKDADRNLESRFKYLPWVLRKQASIERVGELLDVLFRSWSTDDELCAVTAYVADNAEAIKGAIGSIWAGLADGVRHWVPVDGQVKLRIRGSMSRAGFNIIELHPDEFPKMRLRICLLTYGFLDERWATLDENGLMDQVELHEGNRQRQALYLALNLDVVQWLHRFATSGTGAVSRPSEGSRCHNKSRDSEVPLRADGLPVGFHFPGYMRTRGQMSEYARRRCERRRMPLPGEGRTWREYPAGKRSSEEDEEPIEIDVTYDLDHK